MSVNSLPNTVTRQRRDCDLNPGPFAPESSTLTTRLPRHPGGTWRVSNPIRRRRGVRGADGRDAEGVARVGNGTGYPPRQPTRGVCGSVVASPSGVRGRAPAKRFYCLLSVSERLSLQRLLKINVVLSQPLIEKKWVCSNNG